ncbi:MAG: squalene/phytoene synthase family protein [Pseudomonadota bacterium]
MGSMLSPATPPSEEDWSRIDARLAKADEDRWISSRYAPRRERRALIALYALNLELARVRTAVSEPTLGAIRFQWWRDALAEIEAGSPPRKHDVVLALAHCVQTGAHKVSTLQRLVDGHEDAFDAGDRSLEPEAMLMAISANVLAGTHGWGEHLREVAPAYGALRRGDSKVFGPILPKVPADIRPAVAHVRLRRLYSEGKLPKPLIRRLVVLKAMLTGRI